MDFEKLKVALVHDWLTGMRGGEKVLEALCEMFPHADLFTLIYNQGSISDMIARRRIITSIIDHLPWKAKRYRYYLPFFPAAIELLNFKDYDLILSSSHCVAKGIRTPPSALHISYMHTPMRYVWDMYEEYFGEDKINSLEEKIVPLFANYLRLWDVTSANRVDYFLANSTHVAKRIWKYYRREAAVIHPPVDTDAFPLSKHSDDYYLMTSAMVPYKKIDLAIRVFNTLEKPLYIVGDGPEKARLKKQAKRNIRFFDWLPSGELVRYYANCRALIFPGEEDFGIVPVEAQSCGKPVIAYGRGGALETVIGFDGTNEGRCTGVFHDQQSVESLKAAIGEFESLSWDARFIHQHAQIFSKARFMQEMQAFVKEKAAEFFR